MNFDVIISCGSNSWGGLEIIALNQIKQLKKQNVKVVLLCPANSPLHVNARKAGITDFLKIPKNQTISSINILRKNLDGIEVIHSHFSHDLWFIVPALKLKRSKAKLFLTRHMASGVKKKDVFHRYLYNRIERIFAVSEFIKKNAAETCPIDESKIKIMHNGIDLAEFNASLYNRNDFRDELKIDRNKIVIGLVGRMTPGKGHYEFTEAAEKINREYKDKVVFVVAGSSSAGEEKIEADIKKLAKDKNLENMIFTGYRSDIQRVLAGLDILAFPSHEESFGVTLLEAMAMEVPVIASNNAGIIDIIPSEEYGLLIPPKNPARLADGIIRLVINAELRKTLSVSGRKRVEENFDVEKITHKLIEQYGIP